MEAAVLQKRFYAVLLLDDCMGFAGEESGEEDHPGDLGGSCCDCGSGELFRNAIARSWFGIADRDRLPWSASFLNRLRLVLVEALAQRCLQTLLRSVLHILCPPFRNRNCDCAPVVMCPCASQSVAFGSVGQQSLGTWAHQCGIKCGNVQPLLWCGCARGRVQVQWAKWY